MIRKSLVCTHTLLALFLSTGAVFAQAVAGLGGLTGTVRDATGAVVPDAAVVVSNESKGITRNLQTSSAGAFAAPALEPAKGYSVKVTKSGFAGWEAKEIEILVGQTIDLSVALQVSSDATKVEVTTDIPLVESNKSGVSQVVEKAQVDNLPINGRRVDSFVLLTPAVTNDGTFGLISFRGIAGGNSFLTDGNDTTQSYYNENAGRTRISTQISQDAVQEFQVLSNGFSAEFGRASGGVVNTVTRSGTNETHGTGYWFFRNRTLNAVDRYANGFNAPEWRHQAGASVGGAIKKDRLFYFVNFETVKRNFPALNRIINNNLTDSAGNFNAACTATAAQCSAARNFITSQMNVVVPREVNSLLGFAKLDYRLNDKNSLTFSMNAMHWKSPNGIQTQAVLTNGNALGGNGNSTVETRYGKAAWTYIPTSSMVNELRFGWFKDRLSDPANSSLFPSTGPLSISVGGAAVGTANYLPRTLPSENRYQVVENLSWFHGAHSWKFGFDTSTTEDYIDQLYNRFGTYSYSTFTNFALDFSGPYTGNHYNSFSQGFGRPGLDFRTTDFNFYAQDTWKVSRRLTLNYGLRYEYAKLPQPGFSNADYSQTAHINEPKKNFAPRFSLSYQFDDKTVLRAGYGIFYARLAGATFNTLLTNNANYQTNVSYGSSSAGAPSFPNILPSTTSATVSGASISFASPDFHNPYVQQGNVSLERELTRDLGLTVSYLWSRGIGILTVRDLNLLPLGPTVTYNILDAAGSPAGSYATRVYPSGRVDSRYTSIYQLENGGQTWYNGLAIQLRKRMSHGLTASVSYTWSHAIDTANQGGGNDALSFSSLRATYNGDYTYDRASSALDQRHRAVISFLWAPKFMSDNSAFARYLINGWQLSALTTLASAQPTTPTVNVSSAVSGLSNPGGSRTLNGSGGSNRVPFLGFNTLDIDQIYRVDARISRELPFSERFKAVLNFEAFNVTNTISNTAVINQLYTATGTTLRASSTYGTGSASQGFPDGTNARRAQVSLRFVF